MRNRRNTYLKCFVFRWMFSVSGPLFSHVRQSQSEVSQCQSVVKVPCPAQAVLEVLLVGVPARK